MTDFDLLSRSRYPPYAHQLVGIRKLLENRIFALFDEMGVGKTKQVIDAAQILACMGLIDRILIVAPASLRSGVWFDKELGELAKHLWEDLHSIITEYHSTTKQWTWAPSEKPPLQWMITNYEFIRSKARLFTLLPFVTSKTLLVLDESSAIKTYNAVQTRACTALRNRCGRIILLNGTPIANSPMDMYSQGNMMSPKILDCPGITHFRARYAVMGGYMAQTRWGKVPTQVIRWQNLDDLQRRFAPFVIRRLKTECLDLPGKLPPVTLTATLSEAEWKHYKQMRDEMVVWLSESTVSVAAQVITKVMRLNQITSGFLGGLEKGVDVPEDAFSNRPAWLPLTKPEDAAPTNVVVSSTQEIGRSKLDLILEWVEQRWEEDPSLKIIIWCAFRPAAFRLSKELQTKFHLAEHGMLVGDQKKVDRERAIRLLDPRTAPENGVAVVGTYGTGAKGLNFTASHTMLNESYNYDLEQFLQSSDRIDRPGQTVPCSYFDVEARGPQGQKTINHDILMARRTKSDIATWTQAAWLAKLKEE